MCQFSLTIVSINLLHFKTVVRNIYIFRIIIRMHYTSRNAQFLKVWNCKNKFNYRKKINFCNNFYQEVIIINIIFYVAVEQTCLVYKHKLIFSVIFSLVFPKNNGLRLVMKTKMSQVACIVVVWAMCRWPTSVWRATCWTTSTPSRAAPSSPSSGRRPRCSTTPASPPSPTSGLSVTHFLFCSRLKQPRTSANIAFFLGAKMNSIREMIALSLFSASEPRIRFPTSHGVRYL